MFYETIRNVSQIKQTIIKVLKSVAEKFNKGYLEPVRLKNYTVALWIVFCYNIVIYDGNVVKLVDTTDLKSVAVKGVGVQVPPFPRLKI